MAKRQSYRVAALVFGLSILVGLSGVTINRLGYSEFSKFAYLPEKDALFIRPGMNVDVKAVSVAADRSVTVTFSLTDAGAQPLDITGLTTAGTLTVRMIMAYIPKDQNQYVTLTTRAAVPATFVAVQPTTETVTAANTTLVSTGTYRYTLTAKLPVNYDATATHSVGMTVIRDLTAYDDSLPLQIGNTVANFVPGGGPVTKVRDVVRTAACNNACHDPIQAHGSGSRRNVELCVLCHNPGNILPANGQSVNFPVLIHKIHQGAFLPSVSGQALNVNGTSGSGTATTATGATPGPVEGAAAGTPYTIGNSDFSNVVFPQDTRNCETCHSPKVGATQQQAYLLRPNRAACGACHDNVDFASGKNHAGGPQPTDNLCSTCHIPQGELEFDASIKGAHTIPTKSAQLAGINITLMETVNTRPGQNPVVRYSLKDNAGQPILPSDLAALNLIMAGPTTDYKTMFSEAVIPRSVRLGDGTYTYQFTNPIPLDAKGSFAFAAQGNRTVTLNPGTVNAMTVREAITNHSPIFAAVTDSKPVARRTVVKIENCNACHNDLSLHGGSRHDTQFCVMCHQPGASDVAQRPASEAPNQSIHFKFMIHRIHKGEELTRDFTVFGNGGSRHTFNGVRFPGDLRNCTKCHEGTSYQVSENPPDGLLPTIAPREFYSPISPYASACLACHDTRDAAAHAYQMTAPFGESCATCHGQGAEFAVTKVHAR